MEENSLPWDVVEAPSTTKFSLFVEGHPGITIDATFWMTLSQLKFSVVDKLGFLPELFYLRGSNTNLMKISGTTFLWEIGVAKDSTLRVACRLRGGADREMSLAPYGWENHVADDLVCLSALWKLLDKLVGKAVCDRLTINPAALVREEEIEIVLFKSIIESTHQHTVRALYSSGLLDDDARTMLAAELPPFKFPDGVNPSRAEMLGKAKAAPAVEVTCHTFTFMLPTYPYVLST
jgi:hypothetical protein